MPQAPGRRIPGGLSEASQQRASDTAPVLVAGASGFVGYHLCSHLLQAGYRVVATSRDPERARLRLPPLRGASQLAWRRLDINDPASFGPAIEGCSRAVYLIHGMGAGEGYEAAEARAAHAFVEAAEQARVRRIVYLGGVRPRGLLSSRHLRSRLATGEILRGGGVSTVELQAAMIIGGGSESWRIVRDLAARLPLMLLPRWLDSESEPLAVSDVTFAIERALTLDQAGCAVFGLPGPETISARDILRRTAALLGPEPFMLRVPVVTPRLSSYWIRLVTRADQHIAEELVEGLRSDLRSEGDGFWKLFPDHPRVAFEQAAQRALEEEEAELTLPARVFERVLRRLRGRPTPQGSGPEAPPEAP